jgi:hypothetical protein
MQKSLAIVIRTHGKIPVYFRYGSNEDIFRDHIFNYTELYNIKKLYSINISRPGGVCYGNPNAEFYVKHINNLIEKLKSEERVNNTNDLIQYLYVKNKDTQIPEIRELNDSMFGISFAPEIITSDANFTVEKIYTGDETRNNLGLGIYYLKDNGLTGIEVDEIKKNLADMTHHLKERPENYIKKTEAEKTAYEEEIRNNRRIRNKSYFENKQKKKRQEAINKKRNALKPFRSSLECRWNQECKFGCGYIHLDRATPSMKSNCCMNGKLSPLQANKFYERYGLLQPLSPGMQDLLINNIEHMGPLSSTYSNVLSIAAIGVENGNHNFSGIYLRYFYEDYSFFIFEL